MRTVLRWIVAAVVVVHGLIHLLGAAKGFGWADVPQLQEPIGPVAATGWLLATLLVVAAGILLGARARPWWIITGVAALGSQTVILTLWGDAKAGTAVNVFMLGAAALGYAAQGPRGFAAEYRHRLDDALGDAVRDYEVAPDEVVVEADLARLPGPVADYLRRSRAIGQPRVTNLRAAIHGRIRSAPGKPWMPFTGEQVNTFGPDPRRLFHITARMAGVPVDVLHVFTNAGATMRGRAAYIVPVLEAAGRQMDHAETVTLFNDLCILAPAALVDAPVTWQLIDDHHVRGTFSLGAHTVTAELAFDEQHDLVDFVSDDRLRASADGSRFTPQRWSTPLDGYRAFGPRRLAARGEGRWHAPDPEGEFAYLEYRLDAISYNITRSSPPDGESEATPEG